MLDHARAGNLPVLGHMAHQYQRASALFGVARQLLRAGPHLGHGSRRGGELVAPHGLNGIDNGHIRLLLNEPVEDDPQIRLCREADITVGQPQTHGAPAHLPGRFLAGYISHLAPAIGKLGHSLQEQR